MLTTGAIFWGDFCPQTSWATVNVRQNISLHAMPMESVSQ